MDDLYTLQNRGYCLGFHDGKLTNISQNYEYTRTLGDWLFAGSIVEWQGNQAIFEIRNYIDKGEFIEFLLPGTLDNLRITFDEFEDADSGEITAKVSAGQGKKIRIDFNKCKIQYCRNEKEEPKTVPELNIEKIKKLLPQYCIARSPAKTEPCSITKKPNSPNSATGNKKEAGNFLPLSSVKYLKRIKVSLNLLPQVRRLHMQGNGYLYQYIANYG